MKIVSVLWTSTNVNFWYIYYFEDEEKNEM